MILDNASADDTVSKIKKELENFPFEHELIINKENRGFAGGHNQLNAEYRMQNIEYILLLNQDMYLMDDCLEKLVTFMDGHSDVAAVSPRLMKWNYNSLQLTANSLQESFTNQIDSLGLKVFRNRRVIEKYAGKIWEDKKSKLELSHHTNDEAMEVFGVSGALPMYRKSMIDEVGLFDESFGSYKEDVDLAYRIRSAGYKAYILLDTIAYHDRAAAGPVDLNDKTAFENKMKQTEWVKYYSYKNHLMTLIKNEYWQNYLLDLPWIKWYELKKFVYFLLFDRSVLKGLGEIFKRLNDLKIKRLEIIRKRKVGWREIRKWWK